jgi:hypothetical protein
MGPKPGKRPADGPGIGALFKKAQASNEAAEKRAQAEAAQEQADKLQKEADAAEEQVATQREVQTSSRAQPQARKETVRHTPLSVSAPTANSDILTNSYTQQQPPAYPKSFDPDAVPTLNISDILVPHDTRDAIMKAPASSQALGAQKSQKEREANKEALRQGGPISKEVGASSRRFLSKWQNGRPWLVCRRVEKDDLTNPGQKIWVDCMFCTDCETAKKNNNKKGANVWVAQNGGCQRMKLDSVTDHESKSNAHLEATQLLKGKDQQDLKRAMANMFLSDDLDLVNKFNMVFNMAKQHDSLASFPDRCKGAQRLAIRVQRQGQNTKDAGGSGDKGKEEEVGEEDVERVLVDGETVYVKLSSAYQTIQFAREATYFLAEVVRDQEIERFTSSRFSAHAIDEATDKSHTQHLIQYISYWWKGEVRRRFWNIVPIEGQDAESIFCADVDSLLRLVEGDKLLLYKKMVGLGSDGASVMTGGKGGGGAKWKYKNPRLLQNHCCCHRCALCGATAYKEIPELEIFNSQLHQHYNYFSLSVKRRGALNDVQKRMEEKANSLLRDVDPRWLSKGGAVDSLQRNLVALYVMHCEAEDENLSAPFLEMLRSHFFLVMVHGCQDIIGKLNLINVKMQTCGISPLTIKALVNATKTGLQNQWVETKSERRQKAIQASSPLKGKAEEATQPSDYPFVESEVDVVGGGSFEAFMKRIEAKQMEEGGGQVISRTCLLDQHAKPLDCSRKHYGNV